MSIEVSLSESLRPMVESNMQAGGYRSVAECVTALLKGVFGEQGSPISLTIDGLTFYLCRLSDHLFCDWRRRAIAIEEFELDLWRVMSHDPNALNLAETYAVLTSLFGQRSRGFDHWKGAFAFPMALHLETVTSTPDYLLDVVNYRGGVEYRFRKIVATDDPRLNDPLYYPPEPDFSREAMKRFQNEFVEFQAGYWRSSRQQWNDRFLLQIPANLIMFGFDGEEFFQSGFGTSEDFDHARGELSDRLHEPGYYSSPRLDLGPRRKE